jgi:hypothetical protein
MRQSVRVLFDGKVFLPQEPVDLEPNARYDITIEPVAETPNAQEVERPLRRYAALAQDLGVSDLAAQHDHYLYGTPKR